MGSIMNRSVSLGLAFILAGCASVPTSFHPRDPISPPGFSHHAFDAVVRSAVSNGQVNYRAIQSDLRFRQYLDQLDRIDPNSFSREHRLAFWINAYNAFAIKGILDGESPAPYVGWYRYFKARDYAVGGARVNLYDLEHGILRKQFNEPLVHFAIVCASASCPKLQPWAYDGATLDRQLDEAVRGFINDPARNRFDRQQKVASLSMIFKWFESDFAGAAGSVLAFIAPYVNDPELARELSQPGYRIEYLEYDWSLNGLPPEESAYARTS